MTKSDAMQAAGSGTSRDDTRARIIEVAIALLTREGRAAVTTRAVSDAAGVQPPTIYRLFEDMSGLLDAVADHGFATYLKKKRIRKLSGDPVEDLRAGWDLHVQFGLSNPEIYKLMYCDPHLGAKSAAAVNSYRVLRAHIRDVAVAGRLLVSEERAADLVHASGCGMVLTLLAMPEAQRDMGMAAMARDAIIAAITTASSVLNKPGPAAAAVALHAVLPDAGALSPGERTILAEWLERLARQ